MADLIEINVMTYKVFVDTNVAYFFDFTIPNCTIFLDESGNKRGYNEWL